MHNTRHSFYSANVCSCVSDVGVSVPFFVLFVCWSCQRDDYISNCSCLQLYIFKWHTAIVTGVGVWEKAETWDDQNPTFGLGMLAIPGVDLILLCYRFNWGSMTCFERFTALKREPTPPT